MLVDILLESTDRHPRKCAVADPTRELSYRQLTSLAAVMRQVVYQQTRLDRVGIVLPGSTACVASIFGALWAGKIVMPLNFLLPAAELEGVVKDSGIDLIITSRYFVKTLTPLGVRLCVLEDLPLRRKILTSMLRRRPDPPQVKPDDTAVILYTSGTTGQPRGVELSYANLSSNAKACVAHARLEPGHVFLSVLPPFHVFGLTAMVFVPLTLGVTTHYIPRFNPAHTVRTIAEKKVSVFMAVPSMFAAMLRSKGATTKRFESLYMALSGGEPLPPALTDEFQRRTGRRLLQGYGLTETSPVVTMEPPYAPRPGTVGPPIPDVRLRIVDDQGHECDTGQSGEVLVKGPCVMKGYYKRPQDTANAIDSDGWFHTGDYGCLDADGYLSITGRKKEVIIVGGENVFPREIETVLAEHPAVDEVAVIGKKDTSRGEVPVAFVVLMPDASVSDAELRGFARDRLAGFKVPREIRFVQNLPHGPTGKVLKKNLVAEIT